LILAGIDGGDRPLWVEDQTGTAKTPGIALRLAKFIGVSEDFWMNLQRRWDLYKAKSTELKELNTIKPVIQKV
jgi:plasmid maintenance system antidote protein VapI